MKLWKKHANSIILCLFEAVVGVLLLVDPVRLTSGVIIVAGTLLAAAGVVSIIRYFRMEPAEAAVSRLLMKGLVEILAGSFCILQSDWFLAAFPVLSMLYGIAVLLTGIGKIQLTVDLLRLHRPMWFLGAISAGVSVLCAIVILCNPFASISVLWIFTGVALIAEAFFDCITMFVSRDRKEAAE